MADATYNTKVYLQQGGDRLFAISGGSVLIESGANFQLGGGNIAAEDARKILVSEFGAQTVITASSTKLSVINLPANVRTLIISGTSNLVSGSFWLTSVSAGREVLIMFPGASCSSVSTHVLISCSGCTLLGSVGTSISTIGLYASGASMPMVMLRAVEDNVWAITAQAGDVDENI
jgi:hypothetical protein